MAKRITFSANLGSKRVDAVGFEAVVPDFEDFKFIVHHPIIDSEGTQALHNWVVSERTSGQLVSSHRYSTQRQAIVEAQVLLMKVGRTSLEAAIGRATVKVN